MSTDRKNYESGEYLGQNFEYEGAEVVISNGDFSCVFEDIVKNLEMARYYCENERQRDVLDSYVRHFKYGEEKDF